MAVSSFYLRTFYFTFFCCVLWMTLTNGGEGAEVLHFDEPTFSTWKDWDTKYGGWGSLLPASNGYFICTLGLSKDQWFVSPFISLPPSVRTVQVKIKYTVHSCDGRGAQCQTTLNFLKKEQDTESVLPDLRVNPFTDVISKETPATEELIKGLFADFGPKSTSSIAVNLQKKGVYFAFKTTRACVAIFSFKVSYKVCSLKGINLVTFPRTVSPSGSSPDISVNGTCVANAVRTSSQPSFLSALCDSDGNWTAGANVFCVCTAGYQWNVSLNMCEVCPKDSIKKEDGNEPCTKCPKHSSHETPTTRCLCNIGYYRGSGEDDNTDCTSIPSAPVDVKMTFINSSAVRLEWKEPKDKGGRTDLFYDIKCHIKDDGSTPCDSKAQYYPDSTGLKETFVLAFSLQPLTSYEFQIIAKNGVSDIAGKENHSSISVMTKESTPGIPTGVKVIREKGSTRAHLQWSLEKKNGIVLFYEVRYYKVDSGSEQRVNSTFMNITITGLDPDSDYRFAVRAYTSVGFGKFSKETESLGDKGILDQPIFYVGLAVAAFVLLLIGIIIVLCYRKRSNRLSGERFKDLEMLQSNDGHRLYIDPGTYGDLLTALTTFANELNPDCVKLEKIIGGGEFGEVHRGVLTLPNGGSEIVAVKLLKRDATLKSRDDFLSEAAVLAQFNHLNVIEMKGVVTKSLPMKIVLEFMQNGSLDNFLKAHDGQLTPLQLIGMARGVAAGMAYLAGMNFIHRDLAARNILVADNMACKVADFGLSRELESDSPDSEYMTQGGKIAVRWTALEAIKYRKFSSASDVWSYGILLWEIMTFAERPYWDWTNFQVMDRIETGYRLPIPTNCPKAVYHIMLDCWIEDKTRRPKFADIVSRLEELICSPDLLRDDMIDRVNRTDVVDYDQIETVQGWLDSIQMGKYKANFADSGYVALKQLVDVDDQDLVTMGIKLIGHRNKIKKSLKELQDYLRQKSSR